MGIEEWFEFCDEQWENREKKEDDGMLAIAIVLYIIAIIIGTLLMISAFYFIFRLFLNKKDKGVLKKISRKTKIKYCFKWGAIYGFSILSLMILITYIFNSITFNDSATITILLFILISSIGAFIGAKRVIQAKKDGKLKKIVYTD